MRSLGTNVSLGDRRESGSVRVPFPKPDAPKARQEDAAMDGDYAKVINAASVSIAESILAQEKNLKQRAATLDMGVKELLRHVGLAAVTLKAL